MARDKHCSSASCWSDSRRWASRWTRNGLVQGSIDYRIQCIIMVPMRKPSFQEFLDVLENGGISFSSRRRRPDFDTLAVVLSIVIAAGLLSRQDNQIVRRHDKIMPEKSHAGQRFAFAFENSNKIVSTHLYSRVSRQREYLAWPLDLVRSLRLPSDI